MKIKWLTQIEPVEADTIPWFIDNIDADQIRNVLADCAAPLAVSDHYGSIEQTNVPVLCFPAWISVLTSFFNKDKHAPDFEQTNYCANFTANKKQLNRFLMIKLIGWFNITSVDYTWSGAGDTVNLKDALDETNDMPADILDYLCAPITNIKPRFFEHPQARHDSHRLDIADTRHGRFSVGFWELWFRQMYTNTAVSLIAEDLRLHRAALFTEKTVWSVMAQTFPIWIGGYKQAQAWKDMGFDIFEDVIDHGYQDRPSLIERCYAAFELNLEILANLDLAAQLRLKHRQRLINNRDRVFAGASEQRIDHLILQQPESYHNLLQNAVKSYFDKMKDPVLTNK